MPLFEAMIEVLKDFKLRSVSDLDSFSESFDY